MRRMDCSVTPYAWAILPSESPRSTLCCAKVSRSFSSSCSNAATNASCEPLGSRTIQPEGGVQKRRSSGLSWRMVSTSVPAALARTPRSVAPSISASSYSKGGSYSTRKPKRSGCLAIRAAAISLGT